MSKLTEAKAVSQEIVKVVPLVMRTIVAEQHRSSYPMPPAHFRLLTMLAHRSFNLSELALRQAVSLPTMSNSISVLVERGWVNRVPSQDDRRQVLLELRPEGRAVLVKMRSEAEARVAKLLDDLSPDDLKALSAGLVILERALASAVHPRPNSLVQDKVKCK